MLTVAAAIAVLALLIVLNGLLAMSELSIVASRRSRLQERAEAGHAGAAAAVALVDEPNRFLSTVQIGITLIGILAGALGGASLAGPLADWLDGALPRTYGEVLSVAAVAIIITYFSLVAGELAPKRVALHHPEAIASAVARPMSAVARVTSPAVWVLSVSTNFVLRVLRVRPSGEPGVSEEEIRMLVSQAREAGIMTSAEQDMVTGVFELGDRHVSEIMTPRPRVVWIDVDDTQKEALQRAAGSGFSTFPVCRESLDDVIGVVSVKDLWAATVGGETPDILAHTRPAHFLPESMSVLAALEAFKNAPSHAALVVDEYGGTEGLVTLSDVLEELVGEIGPFTPIDEPRIQQRADGSWLVDGLVMFDDFLEAFSLHEPPEYTHEYQTVAGFVLAQLGRVPDAADTFDYANIRVEVIDMDGPRVDKVLVTRRSEAGRLPGDPGEGS
jgi:putative hemolysin